MKDFGSLQRSWEAQTEARYYNELDAFEAKAAALERETATQLAALHQLTGAQLADRFRSIDLALKALASDLAEAVFNAPADLDPLDDDDCRECCF